MKTKKWLLLALCLLLALAFVPATARAEEYSGQCGNDLYWSFDESTGKLTITGSGEMEDYFFPSPWDEYNEQITSISLPSGLTNIGLGAFKDCTKLTSVSIPGSVTTIGQAAFEGCTGLQSVSIPNGVVKINNAAFAECTSLTSVAIPNSVTTLGTYSEDEYYFGWDVFSGCTSLRSVSIGSGIRELKGFEGCSALTSITIPNTVTSIGRNAFYGTGLTSVTIPSSVKRIGLGAFMFCDRLKTISIPNSVTGIGDDAFCGTAITSITIPNSVTSIGDYAFSSCTWLKSITIPDSVTSIGEKAFTGCMSLKTISIPGSVKSIGKSAFWECTGLQSITISNGVTSIGEDAFKDCTALESITIPNSVTSIGAWAFVGCSGLTSASIGNGITIINNGVFSGCSSLQSISIPNSVKTIGFRAFQECSSLTAVTIPSSVTLIDDVAFGYCSGLTSITIPNSVTRIGVSAFRDCISLASVNLPDKIDRIECQAFYNCNKLSSIIIPEGVKSIDERAFKYCSNLKSITIPNGLRIGDEAFTGCSSLTDVYYLSSEEDKAIILESGNNALTSATWHYTYTVTLNPNGGTCNISSIQVTYGKPYGDLPTPTRSGYTFEGWWTTKDSGGKQVTSSTVCYASGNYTLYARWSKSITVSFNANGGTVSPTSKVVQYGQAYGALPTPTRSGYSFAGWWTAKDSGGKQVTASTVCYASGNYTLYARWKAGQTYTVTLNPNGGTCSTGSKTVTYGQAYGTLPVPKRLGYTFAGWWTVKDAGGKKVTASTICYATGNYTLYARWTEGYTMTFDPNGGTVSPTTKVVQYGQPYGTLPTPTKAGYTFTGWWTTKAEGGKKVVSTTVCYASAGYTLYARWTAKKFVITLNSNGGECATATKTVTYGQAYGTMPVPSPRTGYTFAGWYTAKTGGKKVTATTVCYATGNYTLYARWTPKTYTVTLNPNGGSCTVGSKTVTYGQTYGTLPVPTRSGYVFAGWWTKKDTGGKQVFSSTTCYATGNYTLYARWTKNP